MVEPKNEKPALFGERLHEGLQESVDIAFGRQLPASIAYVLRNEADYDKALAKLERYFDREPQSGTMASMNFEALVKAIEAYEAKHWPV